MVEILAYALGIMYTPGPVNLLSLNSGLNGQSSTHWRFCLGVGCAMFSMFLILGYTGAWIVTPASQLIISAIGTVYIAYLAYKIARSSVQVTKQTQQPTATLSFKAGLLMQLLNPKSMIVIVPIVTVQFPAAGITGNAIFFWTLLLGVLAFGAPGSYLLMGTHLGKLISHPIYFRILNLCMALLLIYVAADIAYHHVYLKII
ncbi:MAG: LysE family transporter [Oceanospirillaceae bacterium]|nr:LysE family transporter [Oceanospirillaceae bacterium]